MAATKSFPRAAASRLHGSSGDSSEDQLVIRIPDPRLLRIIARSVLLAAALLFFPWLRSVFLSASETAASATTATRWIDDPFFLPMLLRDLRREGLISPEGHGVFLGDPSSRLPLLKHNKVVPILSDDPAICDHSVDFVLAADGFGDASFLFVEQVLRIGGVIVVRLSSDPSQAFHLPQNYRMVYIRKFGSTIVAIKKIFHAIGNEFANAADSAVTGTGRKLLAVAEAKKEVLNGLEGVFLEPPAERSKLIRKFQTNTRYLPDLMGDTLDGYPRRVFLDVGAPGRAGSEKWFEKWYPKRNSDFEIIRLDVVGKGKSVTATCSDWLLRNVREEEYVVMKSEAEVVEEMVKEKTIGLVDELFLECKNQWQHGKKSRRAYWECLALYGRLRDKGVAVHQWWG